MHLRLINLGCLIFALRVQRGGSTLDPERERRYRVPLGLGSIGLGPAVGGERPHALSVYLGAPAFVLARNGHKD